MLKKRLVGVVTVRDGWAVQSFGYGSYLPLGKPECLVENLDRWGADEILVQVIDRSGASLGPDFALLERLGCLGLETPLIYAGGIRSVEDGVMAIRLGADRLVVDALLHDDPSVIRDLGSRLGIQALIASIPLAMGESGLEWLDYRSRTAAPLAGELADILERRVVSEVFITDWRHEGTPGGFDPSLIDKFPHQHVPLIAFGGISDSDLMKDILARPGVSAVAVGNFLNYREQAIQQYRAALESTMLRPSIYAEEFSFSGPA